MQLVKVISVALLVVNLNFSAFSQVTMPDIFITGTLKEQMDYLTEKTRIYDNYRAIREDMFQKIKSNSLDSLKNAGTKIAGLKGINAGLSIRLDSLNTSLGSVKQNLEDITKSKNSISFMGLEINKSAYNGIVWTIILALAAIIVLGFLVFRRNMGLTSRTRKDFEDLKKEFEAYRKASREAREKMSMAHFYELKKIRGG
jgi:small basic protein